MISTSINLHLITATRGSVQKRIVADANGRPVKDGNHSLGISEGVGEDITVEGLQGLAALLSNLRSNQALVLGQTGLGKQRIIPKDKLDGQPNTIARSKDFYHWPASIHPLLFDHDPEPGQPELTANEFWADLLQVFPEFAAAGRVVTVSTSSAIYDKCTGQCLKPASGHHTYIVVKGNVERFANLLKHRCWLHGKAFFKLAKQNQQTGVPAILERFLADIAVFSPERLAYEAGACFEADSLFEQRLPEPQVFDGDYINLDALPDLTADEQAQAEANLAAARAKIEAQQLEQTCDRIRTEKPELGKREIKQVARQRIQSANQCLLEPDHLLYAMDGRCFKAGDIDSSYNGLKLKDPQEPSYRDGAQVAKIFADKNGWVITSRAHGGCTYRLKESEAIKYWRPFANKLGIQLDYSQSESQWRSQVEAALAAAQMLSGSVEVGTFPDLEIGPDPQLFVLDGQKGTRKTSRAIKYLIADCKKKGLRAVVFTPTRILNRAASRVFGIPTIHQVKLSQRDKVPFVVACPESAHKLSLLDFDVVIFDEANEVVERVLEGNLGNQPTNSRRQFKRLLHAAKTVAIANDMLYKPTLNYVQRVGGFSADQITVIRRRRPQTKMKINLYVDNGASSERWDGTDADQPSKNTAFLDWTHRLMDSVRKGKIISIPCGAQKRARELDRLVSPHYAGLNVRCIDGQYTPKPVKEALASDPDEWLKRERIGAMSFTPTFNSGLSIESEHFQEQFECQSACETASAASQRGERVRDAIWGKRIKERHIYTSSRGLAKYPDIEIFTPEYWADLLKLDIAERSHQIEQETANKLGATAIFKGVRDVKLEDFEDIQELPEFLAIRAREVYFKLEAQKREWTSNGWEIHSGIFATEDERDEIRKQYQRVQQEIIEQKSRIGAKVKPVAVWEGVEPEGPIHAAKIHKAKLCHKLGRNFYGLWDAGWLEAWDIASGDKSFDQLQLRALLQVAQTHPEEFKELRRFSVLRLISKSLDLDASTEARMPIPRRQLETAVLLSQCPEFLDIAFGRLAEWDKNSSHVCAIAAFMRSHAREFATLTSHSQRIHGLQFTTKTPDIKCVNKALKLLGLEPVCLRRQGEKRISIYGFKTVEQKLDALFEEWDKRNAAELPTWEVNRKITRAETEDELFQQFQSHLLRGIAEAKPQWEEFSSKVLCELKIAPAMADTTSVDKKTPLTEVVSIPAGGLIGRWVRVGTSLSKWFFEAFERGKAVVTQTNVYGTQRRVVELSLISAWEAIS